MEDVEQIADKAGCSLLLVTSQMNKEKEQKNKRDCYIWRRRFIENVASEDVALEVDHDRGWLDTRYSRLNVVFRKAIKQWWNSHAA